MRGSVSLLAALCFIPLSALAIESTPAPAKSAYLASFSPAEQPETLTVKSQAISKPKAEKKKFVPPGFEFLLEPQTTQIDVYYGGSYLTSTLATFTPNEITLLTPKSVVAKIPDLLNSNAVEEHLSKELNTNSGLVCITENQSNCGKLEPETVEVIFDENRFRADLFVSSDLLSVRAAGIDPFLPPSSAGLSLLNVFSSTVNGQQNRDTGFNISNSTTLAFRESRLLAISNYNDAEDLVFDTLAFQREFSGQQLQAGYFRSNAGTLVFVRETDFLGISIGSSLDTRTDLNQSSGNELQLFLDSRSRVDILKDDRLISTGIYETGNQILDTSRLPGGAYDIVLRIRDSFGGIREETRFYVKSNRLPPLGQTLYFFDVGKQVSKVLGKALPEKNRQDLFRAGLSRRITNDFGGEVGFISDSNQSLFEAGLFRLGRNYDLRFNLAMGDGGAQAASIISNFRLGDTALGVTLRETRNDNNNLLGSEVTQLTLSASRPIGGGNLQFTARYNQRPGTTDKNYGARYELPTFPFHNQAIASNLQVVKDNGDWQVVLGARMAVRAGSWQTRLVSQAYYDKFDNQETDTGLINNLSSTWQDGDRFLSDVTLALRAVDERFDRTLESELDVASQYGRANVELVYSDENQQYSYGANFYTSVIANSDTITFGGKRQARAGVVLDVRGDSTDAYFDVSVNKLVRDNINIGRKTLIPLAPYQTYEIGLVPRGNDLVDYDSGTQTTTLYPGNVVTLRWDASRILVVFGQVVDETGKPITNGLIEGVVGLATTDDYGVFQAEIKSTVKTISVRTRASSCTIELPAFSQSDFIATLGTVVCR